jgi:histone H2A
MSAITANKKGSAKSSTASNVGSRKAVHKPLTFNTYIHQTLKGVHPDTNIAKSTSMQLDVFMKIFSARLASVAIQVAHGAGRHTVSVKDVETAVNIVLPGELCKNALTHGDKALEAYDTSDTSKTKNKAARSGLSFPPHISEKFLRQQGSAAQIAASKLSVAQRAPVYMAAVIEYLAAAILELGGNEALSSKRQTINVRHLFLATHTNQEIVNLLDSLTVNWLGGGVVPFIHESLVPTKEKQRKLAAKRRKARKENGTTPTPGNARKSLPGSKAMRDIRRYQKTFGLLERKEHFKRFVKEQAEHHWNSDEEKVHFGAGVVDYMQLFIEDRISAVYRDAVSAMAHAGRETVEPRDIEFVWSFIRPTGVDSHTDVGVDNLAEPGLHRLASRGGVKRISRDCYPVIRDIMAFYVSRLLRASFLLMQRQKVKTITLHFLRRGASMVGINLPIDASRRRVKKVGGGDAEETDVEEEEEVVPIPEGDIPETDDEEEDDEEDDYSDDDDSDGDE